jgi:hypothetical protein
MATLRIGRLSSGGMDDFLTGLKVQTHPQGTAILGEGCDKRRDAMALHDAVVPRSSAPRNGGLAAV